MAGTGPKQIIDLTLSDSGESVQSDIPSLAHLTDLLPTSASESVAKSKPGEREAKKDGSSTGPEVLIGGFPIKRQRESGRSGSPTKQPKKKTKSTARKSTGRVTDAQRHAWEAQHASITAKAGQDDTPSDNESHEAATQLAAAERRRSSSKRPSPTKENALAGPGPSTWAQRSAGLLSRGDDMAIDSPPSRPNSSASSRPATPRPSGNTPVPYPPTQSAFQASDEPGSWGHAVPMLVRPAKPAPPSRTASPAPPPGSWGNAVPMVITSNSGSQVASQATLKLSAPTESALRRMPTWATSAKVGSPALDRDLEVPSSNASNRKTSVKPPSPVSTSVSNDVGIKTHTEADMDDVHLDLNPSNVEQSNIHMMTSVPVPLAVASDEQVAEAMESIEDGVRDVSLVPDGRLVRAPSSDSIEEIPADAAPAIFGQRIKKTRRLERPIGQSDDDVMELSSSPAPVPIDGDVLVQRQSDSPSRRQSARLATRTETPVYEFKKNTFSPVRWRKVIEDDSDSDQRDGRSHSSSSTNPTSVDQAASVDSAEGISIWPALPVDTPPPPERMSKAIRQFDTRLIDEWNRDHPRLTSNPALHRMIFESYISDSVKGKEPIISVQNDVDAESIPPNFEFQYSNDMLYHAGVPEPELGLGCGCEGPCNPKSKTCSCLKRQELYNYECDEGFAYTKKGSWKGVKNVSIWECGPNCGCPPECMNRVIQRGRQPGTLVDLFKTRNKGWGVTARTAIPAGTFLGIYSGELITETESEKRGSLYKLVGRTYLFDCDSWSIGNPPKGLEQIDPRLAELAANAKARAYQAYARQEDEEPTYNAYSVDAFHYGVSGWWLIAFIPDANHGSFSIVPQQNYTRFFNHSCDPNLLIAQAYVYDFHPERPILVIFTRRPVKAGEELCISYKGLPDSDTEDDAEQQKAAPKRGKKKVAKTTAAVHVSKNTMVKERCYCKSRKCDGVMFGTG